MMSYIINADIGKEEIPKFHSLRLTTDPVEKTTKESENQKLAEAVTGNLKSNIIKVLKLGNKSFTMTLTALEKKISACEKILADSKEAERNRVKNKKVDDELDADEIYENVL